MQVWNQTSGVLVSRVFAIDYDVFVWPAPKFLPVRFSVLVYLHRGTGRIRLAPETRKSGTVRQPQEKRKLRT